jgi:hypothetical protein
VGYPSARGTSELVVTGPQLLDRMAALTSDGMLRIDQPTPNEPKDRTQEQHLYFEVGQ